MDGNMAVKFMRPFVLIFNYLTFWSVTWILMKSSRPEMLKGEEMKRNEEGRGNK
jgi:hypothetical protein